MHHGTRVLGKPALALSRASLAAFVAHVILLGYVLVGVPADTRPAMAAVVLGMLGVSGGGIALARWWGPRWVTARPATFVSWCNMIAFAALALLDGGVSSPIGYAMLCTLPLAATVMRPRRLLPFVMTGLALYAAVIALGEPAPPGYVLVHSLAFVMLTGVSAQHAHALRVLRGRLARVADVDPLTGCLNRGAFDRRLVTELFRAQRHGEQLSLLLLDLDDFKRVNDQHGHTAGDQLLAWTGATLRDGVRADDVVGRVGGDEFAVLRTGGSQDAASTAERLRAGLAARVPTSVGYATWPVDAVDPDEFRHAADERLYLDKADRIDRDEPRSDEPGAGAEPGTPSAAADVAEPAEPGSVPAGLQTFLGRSLATATDGPWRLALLQIGGLGAMSCAVALFYMSVFSGRMSAWMYAPVVTALVMGVAVVAFSGRLAHVRGRRLLVTALNVVNAVSVVVVLVGDGGVGSPLALGLLNSIPLVALSAPPRLAIPHIAALTGAYGVVAVALGVSNGWMVGSQLAVALSLAFAYGAHTRHTTRQRHELRRVSRSDALTGCQNRRGFEESLTAGLARAGRTGRPVSLVVLDLDRFKTVNDTFGHGAGDALLSWVGERLREGCRSHDTVSRLGGDEFAVVLPDMDEAGAQRFAERWREALRERTSVSIGTATGENGEDRGSLYQRADRALYGEKALRRV